MVLSVMAISVMVVSVMAVSVMVVSVMMLSASPGDQWVFQIHRQNQPCYHFRRQTQSSGDLIMYAITD